VRGREEWHASFVSSVSSRCTPTLVAAGYCYCRCSWWWWCCCCLNAVVSLVLQCCPHAAAHGAALGTNALHMPASCSLPIG
jgi:hypothetical protein